HRYISQDAGLGKYRNIIPEARSFGPSIVAETPFGDDVGKNSAVFTDLRIDHDTCGMHKKAAAADGAVGRDGGSCHSQIKAVQNICATMPVALVKKVRPSIQYEGKQ